MNDTKQVEQKKWKRLFEGSLNRLNGREIPVSQQPICRVKRPTSTFENDSKAAVAAAANSLAALWQISSPKRQGA